MDRLRIGVILPVYNRPGYIVEALDSIFAQTRPADEIVVVDDGSTDATPRVVRDYLELHPHPSARLLSQPNVGAAAARNRAAQELRGCDTFAFLDSDDRWPDDFLHRMERALLARPDAVAALCDMRIVRLGSGSTELVSLAHYPAQPVRCLLVEGANGTPNTVIRAAAFHAAGGYDPSMLVGEDYQLMLRLALRGPWVYAPGSPVTVTREIADGGTETTQLSRKYADRRVTVTQMVERFLLEEGGKDAVPAAFWRRLLARRWYTAGRRMKKLNRRDEAVRCFRRAIHYKPFNPSAWLNLLAARL